VKEGGTINWFGRLPIVSGGRIGVDLFFVLSGYLIGGQLWRELATRGSVNLGRFMLRRAFRIWPLYFFFFVFVTFIIHPGQPWRGWSDLLFLTNYVNHGVVLGSWSLCTEEQFYIVAPLLILTGARLLWPIKRYGRVLLGLLILLPAIRALTWWLATGDFQNRNPSAFAHYIYQPFHTHADGLVVGLLIAYYRHFNEKQANQGSLASGRSILIAMAIFGVGHVLQREVFDLLGVALIFGSMVQYCLSHRPRWLSLVNFSGFYVISRLSYGMYLNHEYMQAGIANLFLNYLPFLGGMPAVQEIVGATLLIAISAVLSLATYCLIEHPFLQIRDVVLSRAKDRAVKIPNGEVPKYETPTILPHELPVPRLEPVLIPVQSNPALR